jgi:hypothetical protein
MRRGRHESVLGIEADELASDATRIRVHSQAAPMSVRAALELCRTDDAFRSQLVAVLAGSRFAAYFWELPPLTLSSLAHGFEFVLTEARGLAGAPPDAGAFGEHFGLDSDRDGVVTFENLGRDATLVVPCPAAPADVYVHLAAFLRAAPGPQVHALLRCVAHEALARVSAKPLWVSTAGMGVAWLHVRLDSRPKYYRHAPYKQAARAQ